MQPFGYTESLLIRGIPQNIPTSKYSQIGAEFTSLLLTSALWYGTLSIGDMTVNTINEIVIENVAHMDNFYVWTQQRTSYNGGVDFEVTAEWKHLRNEHSIKMAIEWSSTPSNRIPFIEQIPTGCGKIEFA